MQKASRQVFNEVFWLALSLCLTIFIAVALFGRFFLSGVLDIHLHDTYFTIAPLNILLPIFFSVTFIVYFIKEFRQSFRRTLSNWILILIGLSLVITLTFLIKIFSQFFSVSWTLYPPLSALRPNKAPELAPNPVVKVITDFFMILQIIILTMIAYIAYRWGTQRCIEKNIH